MQQNTMISYENEDRIAAKSFLSILINEIKNVKVKEPDEKRLLTVNEICQVLNIKKTKLYDMVYKREIPFVKLGAKIMFDRDDIDKFIENNKVKTVNFFNNFSVNDLKGNKYKQKK